MSAKEANTYFKKIDPSKIFTLMANYLEHYGDLLAADIEKGPTEFDSSWSEEDRKNLTYALAATLDMTPEQVSGNYIIKDAHISLALANQMWELLEETKLKTQDENPSSQ